MPFRRKPLQPPANARDDGRAQDIERAGVADRQANDAARVSVDAAMGIEHLHGRSCNSWGRIGSLPRQCAALARPRSFAIRNRLDIPGAKDPSRGGKSEKKAACWL